MINGAHQRQNQPVPVRGFKTFCYGALNICSEIRGGAKNNQCHGTVALARWAPLAMHKVKALDLYVYPSISYTFLVLHYLPPPWTEIFGDWVDYRLCHSRDKRLVLF